MQPTLIPKALRPGDTVGIVAPARWPEPEWLDKTAAWLDAQGFRAKIHPQAALQQGRLAGSDAARAGAINDMFADGAVQAILCARGGAGSLRLLDVIDYDLIRKNPKIFCGFSDLTLPLHTILQRTGLVTFHGPMGWNFAARETNDPRTNADFLRLLTGRYPQDGAVFPARALAAGTAEGRLFGGNMTLLASLIGTPHDWNADGGILFIEDTSEEVYRLDRVLWQMKNAGKFKSLRGVIVGEITDMADDPPYGKTIEDLLREYLPPGIPVCTDFPCGHGDYLTTLPVGVKARMEVGENTTRLTLLEPVVTA